MKKFSEIPGSLAVLANKVLSSTGITNPPPIKYPLTNLAPENQEESRNPRPPQTFLRRARDYAAPPDWKNLNGINQPESKVRPEILPRNMPGLQITSPSNNTSSSIQQAPLNPTTNLTKPYGMNPFFRFLLQKQSSKLPPVSEEQKWPVVEYKPVQVNPSSRPYASVPFYISPYFYSQTRGNYAPQEPRNLIQLSLKQRPQITYVENSELKVPDFPAAEEPLYPVIHVRSEVEEKKPHQEDLVPLSSRKQTYLMINFVKRGHTIGVVINGFDQRGKPFQIKLLFENQAVFQKYLGHLLSQMKSVKHSSTSTSLLTSQAGTQFQLKIDPNFIEQLSKLALLQNSQQAKEHSAEINNWLAALKVLFERSQRNGVLRLGYSNQEQNLKANTTYFGPEPKPERLVPSSNIKPIRIWSSLHKPPKDNLAIKFIGPANNPNQAVKVRVTKNLIGASDKAQGSVTTKMSKNKRTANFRKGPASEPTANKELPSRNPAKDKPKVTVGKKSNKGLNKPASKATQLTSPPVTTVPTLQTDKEINPHSSTITTNTSPAFFNEEAAVVKRNETPKPISAEENIIKNIKKRYERNLSFLKMEVCPNKKYTGLNHLLLNFAIDAPIAKELRQKIITLLTSVHKMENPVTRNKILQNTMDLLLNPNEKAAEQYKQLGTQIAKAQPDSKIVQAIFVEMMALSAVVLTLGVLICVGVFVAAPLVGIATVSGASVLLGLEGLGLFACRQEEKYVEDLNDAMNSIAKLTSPAEALLNK